uniref:Uncharacterized protein n=1 Tax=Biomphalaria glabrata TaxID=6526 RepID=A0A2C9K523_BIOGL
MDVNRCQCCTKSRMELVLNIGSYELAEIFCAHAVQVTHDDLVSAVKAEHVRNIHLLVNHGAPVNKFNDRGLLTYKDSALDIALQSSLTSAASVLLCHGADLDSDCAVTQAFKSKNMKTLYFLLTECAEATKAVMLKPETLIRAVKLGDIQLIQILLEAGADIDGVHNNMTPLMSAFDIEVIKFLLNKGANVNFKTTTTALIYALSWDYFDDINSTIRPKLSPIEMEEKMLPVINLFLKHGANLEDSVDYGCTALMDSAKGYFSTEILKYLIHTGTDVNQSDELGLTALHGAATYHKLDFAEALLKHGAVVNLKSFNGRTPLHEAVKDVNITHFFLENHSKVNAKDVYGNTPLSLAVKYSGDMVDVVKLLIASGADVNHKNNSGMSPLWLAAQNFNLKCMELLIDSKADLGHSEQHQKSALSVLLNDWFPSGQSQKTALILAQHGASAEFVRSDVIHRLIAAGNDGILIQKLIKSGFCPTDIILKSPILNWPETCVSPLAVSLILDSIQQKEAILTSDVELIQELCRLGIDVNRCQCCKKSRMELVLNIGSYELAEILCAHAVQVTHDDLVSAVKAEHVRNIHLLVNHGAPVNKFNDRGLLTYKDSALDIALQSSLTSAASVLLYNGADLDAECAVTQAFKSMNTKTLSFLLTECAETTKAVMLKPETLIRAVKLGDIQLIQILLEAGADIDGVHNNMTPLMSAFDIEVITFLLNKGANVNFKTTTTALIYALSWDYFDDINSTIRPNLSPIEMEEKMLPVIDLFLKHGANLEDSNDYGCTALINSAKGYCSTEVLKYLIHTGTDINRKDDEGFTALHGAATYHKLDFAEALLKYGAIVNLKSFNGRTPLHEAVEDVNITKLFLENQAKVNAKDVFGNTPLSLASKCFGDMVDVVKLLIASGSDVNHKNNSGISPLWLAAQKFNIKCLEFLIDAKADLSHDDQQQKSALSVVLNDWLPSGQCQQTALILAQHGASAEFVRFDVIHRLIAAGNDGILIQKLIKSRFCPTDIILKSPIMNWPETCVSPLAVSLILDSVDFCLYLIENWYLTKSDIKILSRNKRIIHFLQQRRTKALSYLKQVSRQPMRLELLCFITVSSALGSDRGRRQRIHNSKLPVPFQDMLLFSRLEVKVLQQVTRKGTSFLQELSENQVEENDED